MLQTILAAVLENINIRQCKTRQTLHCKKAARVRAVSTMTCEVPCSQETTPRLGEKIREKCSDSNPPNLPDWNVLKVCNAA